MNIAARYNLQKGVAENRRTAATTYNIENELDAYILAKINNNKLILDAAKYETIINAARKELAATAAKEIQNILNRY